MRVAECKFGVEVKLWNLCWKFVFASWRNSALSL